MPQISLDTTIDLVMRLLDDIDGGAPISPARTAHLRNMLLRTEGSCPTRCSRFAVLHKSLR